MSDTWHTLTLAEQLANIGSEVSRTSRASLSHPERLPGAVARCLDLFDRTLDDPRWQGRRFEIARAREVFCDASSGGTEYHTTFSDFQKYFDQFALLTQRTV